MYFNHFAAIKSNTLKENIAIYPNPANDLITISFTENTTKNLQITFFDITGRKVKTIQTTGKDKIYISTKDLHNGIYFIKISDDKLGTVTRKISILK